LNMATAAVGIEAEPGAGYSVRIKLDDRFRRVGMCVIGTKVDAEEYNKITGSYVG